VAAASAKFRAANWAAPAAIAGRGGAAGGDFTGLAPARAVVDASNGRAQRLTDR
jgi:hypothetical protein